MKIVFMGTPDFAVPVLEALAKEHNIVAVYTRAPKESGRGKKVNKTPVHLLAEAKGIEVRTPKSLRNEDEQLSLKALGADMAIVTAYGLILPQTVLDIFPKGCINVHASLLPRWRGAAPIQRAIEAGDKKSAEQISAERDCHEDTADTERSRIRLQAVAGNIQAFIEHNYMDDISLQTVAEAMNYSDAYFCKIFKQCFDKNFIVYLSEYRVARAKELLGDVLINVKDVSQKVGYRDSNYFAKVFKRIAGVTPTEYRMQVLKEAGER